MSAFIFSLKWLHGTVLRRVVDEINAVNAKIASISEDAALLGCK